MLATLPRLNMLAGLSSCTDCPLHTNGFVVPGDGPLTADVMIIAEAPGRDENKNGVPFIGQAGKELERLLQSAGLRRADCYVTNSVKHWPGVGNPDPKMKTIRACRHWLDEEIRQVDPNVIILLGRIAVVNLLGKSDLKKAHGIGQMVEIQGRERLVYQMYHPAAMLHNPELRPVIEEDFRHIQARRVGTPNVKVHVNALHTVGLDYDDVLAVDLETDGLDVEASNIVGISLAGSKDEAHWVDDPALIPEALAEIRHAIRHTDATIAIHNAGFDVPILERYGARIPAARVFDTMLSGYVLGKEHLSLKTRTLREHGIRMTTFEEVTGGKKDIHAADPAELAQYAGVDSAMTVLLKEADETEVQWTNTGELLAIEHHLTPVLRRMTRRGILIDQSRIAELDDELTTKLQEKEEEIYQAAGDQFDIGSPKQLGDMLFNRLGMKPTKYTKTKQASTDREVLESLRQEHPVVPLILEHKKLSKLLSTYVHGLGEHIGPDGRVHTTFRQTGAVSGRLSSAEPNLQNIPSRGDAGTTIRKLFVAAPGNVLLSLDYSQIELRVVAALSQDPEMLNTYRNGGDIHAVTAANITKGDRKLAKNLNFGLVYGMSAQGLQRYLAQAGIYLSLPECVKLRNAFFANRQGLVQWLADQIALAKRQGYNETVLHRRRYYPALASGDRHLIHDAEKALVNHPVQGTAAEIVKKAMIVVDGYTMPIIIQVHDELILEVPEDDVESYAKVTASTMKEVAEEILGRVCPIPVEVGVGWGKSWGEIDK